MYTNSAASRFVGRPAKLCRKCKGSTFIVNQFGGIECLRCTKEQGEFPRLYVVAGAFSDAPDEWNTQEEHLAEKAENRAVGRYDALFEMFQEQQAEVRARTWADVDPGLAVLVEWYNAERLFLPGQGPVAFHKPGRKAKSLKDLNNQLSPFIHDPHEFYRALDIEINVQGVRGPRVRNGMLKADLERLKEIVANATRT